MYTMEDFQHDYAKKHFHRLTLGEKREAIGSLPAEQLQEMLNTMALEKRREVLSKLSQEDKQELSDSLPLEERLAGVAEEQIREYLNKRTAKAVVKARKARQKK